MRAVRGLDTLAHVGVVRSSARLVAGMGGRIDVESTPDGGARVEVRLPEAITVKESTVEEYGAVGARYSEVIERQEVE